MPLTPFWMSSLNTTNIGRIERGLVVMGCVVDVVRVSASIKQGQVEKQGIPNFCIRGYKNNLGSIKIT